MGSLPQLLIGLEHSACRQQASACQLSILRPDTHIDLVAAHSHCRAGATDGVYCSRSSGHTRNIAAAVRGRCDRILISPASPPLVIQDCPTPIRQKKRYRNNSFFAQAITHLSIREGASLRSTSIAQTSETRHDSIIKQRALALRRYRRITSRRIAPS